MDEEVKDIKTQVIIISIIGVLFLIVVGFIIYSIINRKNIDSSDLKVKFNQIYSSEYQLSFLGDNYFIGGYEDKTIDVVIDGNGKEIINLLEEIKYDRIYKMKDGNYLLYNNLDDNLNTYIFDGEKINKYYTITDVSYVKPIIYKRDNESYIVGFANALEEDLYLYKIDNSGVIVLKDKSLVADEFKDNVYYVYNENYLVVKDKEDLMGVIDLQGNTIIDYEYKNIISAKDDSFIAVNKKGYYGIINKDKEILVKFNYQVISNYDNYYLVVNKSNKMALFNNEYKNLTQFKMEYNSLVNFDLRKSNNSINLVNMNDYVLVVNNYLEEINGTEYDKHNLYVIKDGKIVQNIKQVGFNSRDVIYTYDKDYNVIVYNDKLEEDYSFKLDDISKITNIKVINDDVLEVTFYEGSNLKKEYVNRKGEKIDFNIGSLVYRYDNFNSFIKYSDNKVVYSLYDNENKEITKIDGNNVKYTEKYLIVDNGIYKIEIN